MDIFSLPVFTILNILPHLLIYLYTNKPVILLMLKEKLSMKHFIIDHITVSNVVFS